MKTEYLPFEKEVEKIDLQISELIKYREKRGIDYSFDVGELGKKSTSFSIIWDVRLYSGTSFWTPKFGPDVQFLSHTSEY